MQTELADWIRGTPEGDEADAILRRCVHCGFCTATCPTYQLLGDELDGPRGRIYLIKQVLEGAEVTARTQTHLDRCLTCRACETTCPSGVQYGRLVDIGRKVVDDKVGRPAMQKLQRGAMAAAFSNPTLFGTLTALGRAVRPLLPATLADKLPASVTPAGGWPAPRHKRRMLALAGCVQPALSPDTNAATARVLDALGISLVEAPSAGCCGALRYHLDFQAQGLDDMRRNIDAWWPFVVDAVEGGVEAIVMTASGCGSMVKEYGHLLAHDPQYAEKASKISHLTKDLSEILVADLDAVTTRCASLPARRVAFHPPCSLQHGQQVKGVAERVLSAAGYTLTPIPDAHLCCGSAGTYSITQPVLSAQLKKNKLEAIASGSPEEVLTANIGCQSHLANGAGVPVRHWISALDERLRGNTNGSH
jgi:glycolate oxidase iron-sulfur subunit